MDLEKKLEILIKHYKRNNTTISQNDPSSEEIHEVNVIKFLEEIKDRYINPMIMGRCRYCNVPMHGRRNESLACEECKNEKQGKKIS